jgi:hypothetical protein
MRRPFSAADSTDASRVAGSGQTNTAESASASATAMKNVVMPNSFTISGPTSTRPASCEPMKVM